jgi:hypothetical protein
MIIILTLMVIGIIIGLYLAYKEKGFDAWFAFPIIGLLLGMILGFVIATILLADSEFKKVSEIKIVTLKDNNNVKGNFTLGCGSIGSKMKYVYYYEKDGGFKMGSIDCNENGEGDVDVEICFLSGNDSISRVETYQTCPTLDKVINWFALDEIETKYIIRVPKGTITNDFSLDAQ